MGVEYQHFIIPSDPTFVPKKDVIIKVDNLLQKWQLKTNEPKVYNLTDGGNTLVELPLNIIEFDHGILLEYDCEGISGKIVRNIMGASHYGDEIEDDDRYISKIYFIVGTDYRIHDDSETFSISVIKPPYNNNIPLDPYCDYDNLSFLHSEAYSSSLNTLPPVVEVSIAERPGDIRIGNQNFKGYYRTALVIDCGKDLPDILNFEKNAFYKIESTSLIQELEEVIGTDVIQIGKVG